MTDRKKARSVSEETSLRQLVSDLTNLALEIKASQAKQAEELRVLRVLCEASLEGLTAEIRDVKKIVSAAATVGAEARIRVDELHVKLIGSADGLGKRLYDLESEKRNRNSSKRTSRPPRRG